LGLIVGALFGAAIAFLATPLIMNWYVRREIVAHFRNQPLTVPVHLHTPDSFHRLVTESSPTLARWITVSACAKALSEIKADFTTPDHVNQFQTNASDLYASLKDEPLGEILDEVGVSQQQLSPFQASRSLRPIEQLIFSGAEPPEGFHLPAEYESLDAVLLSWPTHYPTRWAPHAALAKAIFEAGAKPIILVSTEALASIVQAFLSREIGAQDFRILIIPTDDVWIRDYGPHFVKNTDGEFALVASPFVPTEHPYQKHDNNSQLELAAIFGVPFHRLPLIMEGGNLVTDGCGTAFMFDSVFYHNPELNERTIEELICRFFGMRRVVFLPSLKDEITGHCDMVLKFINNLTVVVAEAPKTHKWASSFDLIASQIDQMSNLNHDAYNVQRLPICEASNTPGSLWSYVNSLTVNETIIMPAFEAESDDIAEQKYYSLGAKHVTKVNFRDFPLGAIHCQSKEVPSGVLKSFIPNKL